MGTTVFAWIDNMAILLNHGIFAESRILFSSGSHQMNDQVSSRQEIVGDQPSMTAPPYSFGAHDRDGLLGSNSFQFA